MLKILQQLRLLLLQLSVHQDLQRCQEELIHGSLGCCAPFFGHLAATSLLPVHPPGFKRQHWYTPASETASGGCFVGCQHPLGSERGMRTGEMVLPTFPVCLNRFHLCGRENFRASPFFPKIVWKMSWTKMSPLISLFLLYLFYFRNIVGALNLYEKLLLGGLYFNLILEI